MRATGTGLTAVDEVITLNVAGSSGVTMALSPTSLVLTPGSFGTTTATLTRSNFTGSVSLAVITTLPAGVTATITQPGTGSSGSVRFNLATSYANFSSLAVTVRATGTGLTAVDEVVTLNVAGSSGVTMALSPTALTLTPGSFGTTTATLTRSNFTGSVSLAVVTTLPAGLTATITQPGTGSTGSVRFNLATSYANFSNLAVTVRATGTGLTAVDEVVTLDDATTGCSANVECEPNNTAATATPLGNGQSLSGALSPTGDVDWFTFTVTSASDVTITATTPGTATQMPAVEWFDVTGTTRVSGNTTSCGINGTTSSPVTYRNLPIGTYRVRVAACTGWMIGAYTLGLTATTVAAGNDPFEPNNTAATATPLGNGQSLSGALSPTGMWTGSHSR